MGKSYVAYLFVSSLYKWVEALPAGNCDQSLGINEVHLNSPAHIYASKPILSYPIPIRIFKDFKDAALFRMQENGCLGQSQFCLAENERNIVFVFMLVSYVFFLFLFLNLYSSRL